MKPELKTVWVDALLNGGYEQGQGVLRNNYKAGDETKSEYCCLGVLCDKLGIGHWGEGDDTDYYYPIDESDDDYYDIREGQEPAAPVERYVEAELDNNLLEHTGITPDQMGELIDMNDNKGASFEDIAVYIEEHL